jgi:hypothetical protein
MNRRAFFSFLAAAPVALPVAAAQALQTSRIEVGAVDVQALDFIYVRYGDRVVASGKLAINGVSVADTLAAQIEDAERTIFRSATRARGQGASFSFSSEAATR